MNSSVLREKHSIHVQGIQRRLLLNLTSNQEVNCVHLAASRY